MSTPIYTMLGFERLESKVPTQERVLRRFHGLGRCPAGWSETEVRYRDVAICLDIAIYCHLGLDVSHLDVHGFIDEGAKIAVDYFFGDYIQADSEEAMGMRKSRDIDHISWFEVFRNGLLLAQMAGNSDAEKQLVDWVEPWLPFDESSFLVSDQDNSYYKLLAQYISAGDIISRDLVDSIMSSRKQRPKLLLKCLKSIHENDTEAFSAGLIEFLEYFVKRELARSRLMSHFSIEASSLYQLAQRRGIAPAGLNDKQKSLIMTRETLGWES